MVVAVALRRYAIHQKTRAGKGAVAMGFACHADSVWKVHRRDRILATGPEVGANIQQGRREHVPGHAADSVQMDRRHRYLLHVVDQ